MELFSDELELYEGELPEVVKDGLREIRGYFGVPEVKILRFTDTQIAVPVTYEVSLPTRGTINGIDIREEEPALIVMSVAGYPGVIPRIMNDRKDFPKTKLPHLYMSKEGRPASFCLVRNSPNEWFSNKRMSDLLKVGAQWLYKAANGILVEDNNEFDPTRLEDPSGSHAYKYDTLNDVAFNNREFAQGCGFALLASTIQKGEGALSYKSIALVSSTEIDQLIKFFTQKQKELDKQEIKPLFSILIWSKDEIENDYNTQFPENYKEIKEYFHIRNIDIAAILKSYIDAGYQLRNGIPVIHAIRRPKKVVGYNGHFEFINFMIAGSEADEGVIPDTATVWTLQHNEPFSYSIAKTLSGEDRTAATLYIGAGSLGSKMILHDGRIGKQKIGVLDHDNFLEHNLARHVLFEDNIGDKKAKAVTESINAIFTCDDTAGYKSFPNNLLYLPDATFNNYNWLVDTSASRQVHNLLIGKQLPDTLNLARCELVNDGKLGLLYVEGSNRNPRLDDLMNLTHYMASVNRSIEQWRRSDVKKELKTLDVGLGCSSSTTVMADDTISYHASLFSKVLYKQEDRKDIGDNGLLFRSIFEDDGIPRTSTEFDIVPPFEVYSCQAGSGWQIRFPKHISSQFFHYCKKRGRVETGGVLIGIANYKTKTIHVFELIAEPKGSKGTCVGFTRGIGGLPRQVDLIKEKTGQVIGYVGEWHTHPMNLEQLSPTDKATIVELRVMNRKVPIPTLAIIVTANKILPFVFE
jgi:hypothetical protein